MLAACSQAGVSRFIMSDWALGAASHFAVELLASKARLVELCAAENNRKQGGDSATGGLAATSNADRIVECSTIQIGAFMNYFVQGYDKSGRDPNLDGGLVDDLMLDVLDIKRGVLYIPVPADEDESTGAHISLTDINDIGPLITAGMDLPPGQLRGIIGCVSQTTTFGHVRDILVSKCGKKLQPTVVTKQDCLRMDQETKNAFDDKLQSSGEFDVHLFKRRMVMQIYAFYCEEGVKAGVVAPELN